MKRCQLDQAFAVLRDMHRAHHHRDASTVTRCAVRDNVQENAAISYEELPRRDAVVIETIRGIGPTEMPPASETAQPAFRPLTRMGR